MKKTVRSARFVSILVLSFLLSCGGQKPSSNFRDSIVVSDSTEVWTADVTAKGCRLVSKVYQDKMFFLQPCYAPVLDLVLAPAHEVTYQVAQPLHPLELSTAVQNVILPIRGDDLTWPSVSFDGKYVAFLLPDKDLTRKLVIIDSAGKSVLYMGTERTRLGGSQYPYGHRPAWLSDSSGVICDVSLPKEYLVLFRFSAGGMDATRLGEGFAPAVSQNGEIAFYVRDNSSIELRTGLINMKSLTIGRIKTQYRSRKILDYISPAWSRQNSGFLFFLEEWPWYRALWEGEKLCVLDTSSGRVFYPDRKGALKYSMHFGFDTLPR